MDIYSLKQIISHARENSPLYSELYRDVDFNDISLEDLPILSHELLMEIVHDKDAICFFNQGSNNGIIYQSSATTGKAKATLFGRSEWQTTVKLLASNHWKSGLLKNGDVVANLCVGGSASFMFVHGTIENFPGQCCELPIGSDHSFDYLIETWGKFSVNVLAGVNSTFLGLAAHLIEAAKEAPEITRILCGGELLYGKQLELIKEAFPNADLVPFMYATTETGLIGLSEPGFAQNEFYVCHEACQMEIVDPDTKEVIEQPNKQGLAVITSLIRTAAPAIRLEIGDYAQWIDSPGCEKRKFSIHGRRYLQEYPFYNARISESDIYKLIKCIEKDLDLLKLKLEIYDSSTKFVIVCYGSMRDMKEVHNIVISSLKVVIPEAIIPSEKLDIKLVDFSYFSDEIRRKERLISDLRKQ